MEISLPVRRKGTFFRRNPLWRTRVLVFVGPWSCHRERLPSSGNQKCALDELLSEYLLYLFPTFSTFALWTTHPHLAQVPVVVVRLVLVGQFPAQDDAVLPALKTREQTVNHPQHTAGKRRKWGAKALQRCCRRSPLGGSGESELECNLFMQVLYTPAPQPSC